MTPHPAQSKRSRDERSDIRVCYGPLIALLPHIASLMRAAGFRCPGHPRLGDRKRKGWMPGSSSAKRVVALLPGMTNLLERKKRAPTLASAFPPHAFRGGGIDATYLNVIANPLRSAFANKPTSVPESSSTAPFWLVSTIARAPPPTASPAPAAA
jgi:hypothetical protein